ncbi:MAG: protein-glutamate O-methyltransferase family protein [Candidatus Omnitrophica bacterium]|nr:protein-glutamate O-methyltransferase family protein [Candidatus Omnitrophota bacterium]
MKEASDMLPLLAGDDRINQGEYYLMALYNLGLLKQYVPDLRKFVKEWIEQYQQYLVDNSNYRWEKLFITMNDVYILETAWYFGLTDLVPKSLMTRVVNHLKNYKKDEPYFNSAYGLSYVLTGLSEVGMEGRLFEKNDTYDGMAPLEWVIRNFPADGVAEKITLPYLHHALINLALRMRGMNNKDSDLFKDVRFLNDQAMISNQTPVSEKNLLPEKMLLANSMIDSKIYSPLYDYPVQVLDNFIKNGGYRPEINAKLDSLKQSILNNEVIQPLPATADDAAFWNEIGKDFIGKRWHDAQVSQVVINSYFSRLIFDIVGRDKDPYAEAKNKEFQSAMASLPAIIEKLDGSQNRLAELVKLAVWGNQADLVTQIDRTTKTMVIDQTNAVAQKFMSGSIQSITYEADNAGSEILSDLLFIHHLLTNKLVKNVRLMVKNYPYFISDATVQDVLETVESLANHANAKISAIGKDLKQLIQDGQMVIASHPFSTTGVSFKDMPADLQEEVAKTDLWVLKGDANYNRIADFRRWKADQDMKSVVPDFSPSILILRAAKTNVFIGADKNILENLSQKDPQWFKKGVGGIVQFVDRIQDSPASLETANSATKREGGIDLNLINLKVKNQGQGLEVNVPVNMKNLDTLSIDGFIPVIIEIVPFNATLILSEDASALDKIPAKMVSGPLSLAR